VTTRTPEGRIATREIALLRYAEGYPLPEAPETGGKWTREFEAYANTVNEIMRNRYTDCYRVGVSDDGYQRAELDFRLMDNAVTDKKARLIGVYANLLKDSLYPNEIRSALPVLDSITGAGPLTHEHVNVYYDLQETVYKWRASRKLGKDGPPAGLLNGLVRLCFEEMSERRLDAVKALLDRGMTNPKEIRAALGTFDGIESPLTDGVL
jgi:hypothetical protein